MNNGDIVTDRGILDIMNEGYGFIRSANNSYEISNTNSYVPAHLIHKFSLQTGDFILGKIKEQKKHEKNYILSSIDYINYEESSSNKLYPDFNDLEPDFPNQRLLLERPDCLTMRMTDIFSPVGMGQRGLIVAPPKSGKTTVLHEITTSIINNHQDCHLIVLLVGERPEEVTEAKRIVSSKATVVASTFDDTPQRQVQVAELVLCSAKRLVETGKNVIILLDSLTRLVRAYNNLVPSSGKVLSGGIEQVALLKGKQFFGAARNIKNLGSLTILSTVLVETGSKMDEIIFEEFKGTGNMELYLKRKLAERDLFPAISCLKSGTRRLDLLLNKSEINKINLLRKLLLDMDEIEGLSFILDHLKNTENNQSFFDKMNSAS
jgi:transcription termination factor Rho